MRRPLRVAFDARSLASPVLRGWDRYTVGLVAELVRQGVEVTLFHYQNEPPQPSHVSGLGCQLLGLPAQSGLSWEQLSVPFALWRGKFDLFHAPAEQGVPLIAPCPVVLTIHSVTDHSYCELVREKRLPGPVQLYLGYTANLSRWHWPNCYLYAQFYRVSHFLTPSDFCREEAIRFLGLAPEQVTTTPLAVPAQFQRPANSLRVRAATLQRLGIKKPFLLYVGGYEPHKNVPGLLKTFALVHQVRPELSLVVIGSKGLPAEVRRYAEEVGLDPAREVNFLVNITDDLTDIYDEAELLVTLSWRETFCVPALEAMSRGLPVVASAWGAAPEVIGKAGRLVDPRDHESARDAILELLAAGNRDQRAEELKQTARRFSWAKTAERTHEIYEHLVWGRAC